MIYTAIEAILSIQNDKEPSKFLVLAPLERDADLLVRFLGKKQIPFIRCHTMNELITNGENHGPAIITQEALTRESLNELNRFIREQPAWSDLPVVLLID